MEEYPEFEYFSMAYWNEVCLEIYGNISRAALEFRKSESVNTTKSLGSQIEHLLSVGAFPEILTAASRKKYGMLFPNHHRYISKKDAEDVLLSLGRGG